MPDIIDHGDPPRGQWKPPMGEQERHHAKLDYDRAMEGDDMDRLIWFGEWGGRLVSMLAHNVTELG